VRMLSAASKGFTAKNVQTNDLRRSCCKQIAYGEQAKRPGKAAGGPKAALFPA
jgi:hypothetical protein